MKRLLLLLCFISVSLSVSAKPVRVFYKPDGSITVRHLVSGGNESLSIDMPSNDYEDIDSSELPTREFRNAWEKKDGGGVKVNQVKKKEIIDKKNVKVTKNNKLKALGFTDEEIDSN